MKLIIDQSLENNDVEITIKCGMIDEKLEHLISQIRLYSFSITGKKDGSKHMIKLETIFYFESVNENTFIYCDKDVFECDMKLYEIEQMLEKTSFVRISKAYILNTACVESVKAYVNGRFEASLENGEKVIINRHYAQAFKEKFDV